MCVLGWQICQSLRIVSFISTQLPGPNYHCHVVHLKILRFAYSSCFSDFSGWHSREVTASPFLSLSEVFGVFQGEPTATLPSPTNIKDVILLNCTYLYIHDVLHPWKVITAHCMKLQAANTSYFFRFWLSIWQRVLTFPYDLCVTPVPYGVIYGCGDLIFSSHMTFALTFCHTYNKYGTKRYVMRVSIDYIREEPDNEVVMNLVLACWSLLMLTYYPLVFVCRWIKKVSWLLMIALSFLIIASRKHYTVDVVVAWYVTFLCCGFLVFKA